MPHVSVEDRRANRAEYYVKNRDRLKAASASRRALKIVEVRTYDRMRVIRDAEKRRIQKQRRGRVHDNLVRAVYLRRKRAEGSTLTLAADLRSRLNSALTGRNRLHLYQLLGCSLDELKAHLQAQFKSGMTWTNRRRTGWHIDHIRPLASFDLTDPEQLAQACHYKNLQPLWAADNLIKGARYAE
jgi:hypothetical protein